MLLYLQLFGDRWLFKNCDSAKIYFWIIFNAAYDEFCNKM